MSLNYDVSTRTSIRVNAGILKKQFRTEGNDALSNPYKDPGHYWLSSGLGYAAHFEYLRRIAFLKRSTKPTEVKLLAGISTEIFNYKNLTYNDIPLMESLGVDAANIQNNIINYNLYLGIAISRR